LPGITALLKWDGCQTFAHLVISPSKPSAEMCLFLSKRMRLLFFVSALMPVTQQYRLGMEASVVKLAREIAQCKLDKEVDDTRAKVKSAYYKMILDQSLLATINVSIKY